MCYGGKVKNLKSKVYIYEIKRKRQFVNVRDKRGRVVQEEGSSITASYLILKSNTKFVI